jgi:hypothetical protein
MSLVSALYLSSDLLRENCFSPFTDRELLLRCFLHVQPVPIGASNDMEAKKLMIEGAEGRAIFNISSVYLHCYLFIGKGRQHRGGRISRRQSVWEDFRFFWDIFLTRRTNQLTINLVRVSMRLSKEFMLEGLSSSSSMRQQIFLIIITGKYWYSPLMI